MSNVQVLCDALPRSQKFGRRSLVIVPMAEVEGWENNPTARTKESNLVELADRLGADVGQLQPASVVSYIVAGDRTVYRVVDGHRRKAILALRGEQDFLAIHYTDVKPGTDKFGLLFETINTATRGVGIRERVWLALKGERAAAGDDACKLADEIENTLSSDTLIAFVDAGCPIQAFRNAKGAAGQLQQRAIVDKDRKSYRKFVSQAVAWQLEQNEQQALKLYLTAVAAAAARGVGRAATTMCKKLYALILSGMPLPKDNVGQTGQVDDEDNGGDDEE